MSGIDPLDHYANVGRRILELRAKLAARKGRKPYDFSARKAGEGDVIKGVDNVSAIEAEIARLELVQAAHDPATKEYDL